MHYDAMSMDLVDNLVRKISGKEMYKIALLRYSM